RLGKPTLYQLSYVRAGWDFRSARRVPGRGRRGRGVASPLVYAPGVSARAFAAFMGVLAVVGLLGYGLVTKSSGSLAVGDAFPAQPLERLDGSGTASIADWRGKWVLVNVWASWCGPCRAEAPALQAFYRRHRADGFTVVGVDFQDNTADATRFLREFGVTYPQLRDGSGDYAKDELGATGVPESFLVSPAGKLVLHDPGQVTESYLERYVAPAIAGGRRGACARRSRSPARSCSPPPPPPAPARSRRRRSPTSPTR